jgi:hypothetical protein
VKKLLQDSRLWPAGAMAMLLALAPSGTAEDFSTYAVGALAEQPYLATGYRHGEAWGVTGDPQADSARIESTGLVYSNNGFRLRTRPGALFGAFTDTFADKPTFARLATATDNAFTGFTSGSQIGQSDITANLYLSFLIQVSTQTPLGSFQFLALSSNPGNQGGSWDNTESLRIGKLVDFTWYGIRAPGAFEKVSSGIDIDDEVHLFVAKLAFQSNAEDTVTVWLDPDLSGGETNSPFFARGTGPFSFTGYNIRGTYAFRVDEVRFGRTWESVVPVVDRDKDSLPDEWEEIYFGASGAPGSGPSDDPDQDGVSNRDEYLAGTLPTRSQSVFRVSSYFPVPTGETRLQWYGRHERDYQVYRSGNLLDWISRGPVYSGSGATITVDEMIPVHSNEYFRVQAGPSPLSP